LTATPSLAEPPKHLPKETREDVGKPTERACYDFEGYKALLKLDNAHTACLARDKLHTEKDAKQEKVAADLRAQMKLLVDSNATLNAENERLFKLWKEENKRRHQAENKPQWGSWAGWTVAGVATAVLAGFILKDQLGD
jgi:hypothetical protein